MYIDTTVPVTPKSDQQSIAPVKGRGSAVIDSGVASEHRRLQSAPRQACVLAFAANPRIFLEYDGVNPA